MKNKIVYGIIQFQITFITLIVSFCSDTFGQIYIPGELYYGRNEYIAYYAGDLPVIFSAGHGGFLTPDEIPDRTYGTTVTDANTIETSMAIRDAVYHYTGYYPHLIISRLKRTKLDPNRDIVEGAQGNEWAEQAWQEYHGFIESAKDSVTAKYGKGFYIDIHGHGHSIQRLELGYLLSGTILQNSDSILNSQAYIDMSSVRALADDSPVTFSDLLRGPKSIGTLFEDRGIPAVPSTNQPDPGIDNPFFSGGYSTIHHGSRDNGTISGVQLEANYTGIRDNSGNRENFAEVLTEILDIYFQEHFEWDGLVTNIPEMVHAAKDFLLYQNYPNPFNMSTKIKFDIPFNGFVSLIIYNINGQKIIQLLDRDITAGKHTIIWDASQLPGLSSGMYFYRIDVQADKKFTSTRKLMLLK